MDIYESFKLAFQAEVQCFLSPDELQAVLRSLDAVSKKYSVIQSDTLTVCNPESNAMEFFLVSKSVEEKSPGTLKTYRSYLTSFFAFVQKPVNEITSVDIRMYLDFCKRQRRYKDNSLETVRRIINSFFDFCQTEEIVTKNPCDRIKPIRCEKTARKAMKPIELEYMREACENVREKAIVDFLYSTGCRVSEVCHCKLADIDWEKKTVLVRRGKGKVTRVTFLNPEAEVSLKKYLAIRHSDSEYIFVKTHGNCLKPIVPETIQRLVKKISQRALEVKTKVTPHVFRHTVATIALGNGMPVAHVQKFLGHANINTTMIYAEVNLDDVRTSHLKFIS